LKYVRVVRCAAEDGDIRVEMLGEDQETHRFDVSSECAGLLAASLAVEFEKIEGQDKDRQLIRPTGMQTARTERGEPMILMSLQGGAELPLVFKPESLGVLISELQRLMRSGAPEPQIRWH